VHPKPKGIEIDPDALVDLEGRIAEARTRSMVKEGVSPLLGLGDRLERAKLRYHDVRPVIAATTAAPAQSEPPPNPAPSPPATDVEPAKVTPRAADAPSSAGADWARPLASYEPVILSWPEKPAFADTNYEAFEGGFMSAYNSERN
jgi:hypothetical protein